MGVLNFVGDILEIYPPTDLTICWDEGVSRWRSEYFPEYKKHRVQKDELDMDTVYAQLALARRFLDAWGVRQLSVKGVEADDLLAWLAEYYFDTLGYDEVVIVSSDHDLWQLVRQVGDRRIFVYDSYRKTVTDAAKVVEELGVPPDKVPEFKALAGDASDGYVGVKGVGPKTAAELLSTHGGLSGIMLLQNPKKVCERKLLESRSEIEFSYRLAKIPSLSEAPYLLSQDERASLISQLQNCPPTVDVSKLFQFRARFGDRLRLKVNTFPPWVEYLSNLGELFIRNNLVYGTLEGVDTAVVQCTKCSLHGTAKYPCGVSDAEIMLVTSSPEENDQIDTFLSDCGLTRQEVWITSVNKCKGWPTSLGEANICAEYLRNEVALIEPKFLIVSGTAVRLFSPYYHDFQHCGEIVKYGERWVATSLDLDVTNDQKRAVQLQFVAKKIREFLEARDG